MTRMNDEGADAHASLMGTWGLGNELVCWLIGRGHGEIVALRGEEFRSSASMRPPVCPSWEDKREKPRPTMLYRPGYWACYHHHRPFKIKHRLIEPEIPDFPGSFEDALDQVVDLRYGKNPLNGLTEWHYETRML